MTCVFSDSLVCNVAVIAYMFTEKLMNPAGLRLYEEEEAMMRARVRGTQRVTCSDGERGLVSDHPVAPVSTAVRARPLIANVHHIV